MSIERWIGLAACGVIAGAALLWMMGEPPPDQAFCTADMIVVDVPDGWDLNRDGANDCRWTLFDSAGERAPDEVYEGLSIEAPPPVRSGPESVVAGVVFVAAVGIGIAVVVTRSREREG
ncbi:MAG: hypothetical protein ABFR89_08945 [Actinomycetota bacterium]